MAYSDKVLDHYENPRNVGSMDKDDQGVGTGMVGAPACGDVMKLQIKIKDDIVEDACFKTYGCGSAIASSTMFVEMLVGKTVEEAQLIKDRDIAEALELPSIKLHCSVLAEASIKDALKNWDGKREEFIGSSDSMIGHNNPPQGLLQIEEPTTTVEI